MNEVDEDDELIEFVVANGNDDVSLRSLMDLSYGVDEFVVTKKTEVSEVLGRPFYSWVILYGSAQLEFYSCDDPNDEISSFINYYESDVSEIINLIELFCNVKLWEKNCLKRLNIISDDAFTKIVDRDIADMKKSK